MDPSRTREEGLGDGSASELSALFAEALERLREEGEQALESLLAGHPERASEVRDYVDRLRKAGLAGGGELPQRIGDFRLLKRLGGGGMGVVVLALQESLGREVALKLVRPELLVFPGTRRRFEREVRAVARMEHPGIVPVYAVGEDGGVPWFAMQRVHGASLGEVLDLLRERPKHALRGHDVARALERLLAQETGQQPSALYAGSWEEACLRMARELAEALEHAHRRGVLHRDVKPSNAMTTLDGRVMLVDFGLASAEGSTRITQTNSAVGSVPYMSPEQLEGRAGEVDRRSDVYSLGVSLYELLTLERPFEGEGLLELRRQILEGRPPAVRSRNPAVSRDAETVCLKAMERERERRYATAADLARDLTNVLEHRPVEARPAGVLLRLRRVVRRHPARSLAAALAALVVVGAPSLYAWHVAGVGRLEREKAEALAVALAEARAQRSHAGREAAVAERVIAFLTGMFEEELPSKARGERITVKEVLDRAPARLQEELVDEPVVRARIQGSLAHVYQELGLGREARALLHEALPVLREGLGDEHPTTLSAMHHLGVVEMYLGHFDEAEALYREALEGRLRVLGPEHEKTFTARNDLALLYNLSGRFDEAERTFREAIEHAERVFGPEHDKTLTYMHNLASVYRQASRPSEAAELFGRVLETRRRVLGSDHPNTLTTMFGLGQTYRLLGRLDEAAALLEESYEGRRRVLGEEHPFTLSTLSDRGLVAQQQGLLEEAERLFRAVVDAEEALGPDHPYRAAALLNLGYLYATGGRRAEATPIVERAVEAAEKGDEKALLLRALALLGSIRALDGREEEALELLSRAYQGWLDYAGEDFAPAQHSALALGQLHVRMGEREEAARLFSRGAAAAGRMQDQELRASFLEESGRNLLAQGQAQEAATALAEALDWMRGARGPEDPRVLARQHELARAFHEAGRLSEAQELYRRTLSGAREVLGQKDLLSLACASNLGALLQAEGELEGAEAVLAEAFEAGRGVLEEGDPRRMGCALLLAEVRHELGRNEEALPLASDLVERIDPTHPDHARARELLDKIRGRLEVEREGQPGG